MLNIFTILVFAMAIGIVILGYIAFNKNRKSPTNQWFLALTFISASWCIFNYLENTIGQPDLAILFLKLDFIFAPFMCFSAMAFFLNFPEPNPNKKNKYLILIALIITGFLAYLTLNSQVIKGIATYNNQIGFDLGRWFVFYGLVVASEVIGAITYQIMKYRKSFGIKKMQILYVLIGFSISSLIIMIFNLFLQNKIPGNLFQIANLSIIFWVISIAYAIIRYHLLDVWLVLRLGAIFTLTFTIIAVLYVFLGQLIVTYLHIQTPWNDLLLSLLITAGFIPLRNLIEILTDKIFFRKRYKFNDVTNEIEGSIHSAGLDLDKALAEINRVVSTALRLKGAGVLVLTPEGNFEARNLSGPAINNIILKRQDPIILYLKAYNHKIIDREELEREVNREGISETVIGAIIKEMIEKNIFVAAPIVSKDELIRIYIIDRKLSRDLFTDQDLEVIKHASSQMSFIIDNTRSYEELKRLDADKSNFISVVSHQLRTPVTISRLNLETALDKKIKPKVKTEAIATAYEGVTFLSRQFDQMLTVLEIEEKSIEIKKTEIDINQLVKELLSNYDYELNKKNLKIKTNFDKLGSKATCDANKIKKVLDALINNAIDYSRSDGEITISTFNSQINNAPALVVSIADNGIGIKEEAGQEIFKKFFRGEEAVATVANGFGLGLYIAKNLIKAHGGDVWFESQKEKGATFYFSLPIDGQDTKKLAQA